MDLDTFIQAEMGKRHIPGMSVGVVRNGEAVLLAGYGLANVELSAPATADSVYSIASITKLFTATAVLILVEQQSLALDDPLGAYLVDLPPAWQPITLRQILTHQSGLPNYTSVAAYWETTRLDVAREAILDLVAQRPLDFAPGARWQYDNTGYYLLGLLIEQVSGQRYGDFLTDHIFTPLDMGATRVNDPYAIVSGRAAGYTWQDERLKNAEYYSPSGAFSAGVLLSSVRDLARWILSLGNGQVVSEATQELMWTPHPSRERNERRLHFSSGLGWFLVDYKGRTFTGHNGGMIGFASSLIYFRPEQLGVVVLCNSDVPAEPHAIANGIADYFR